MSEDRSHAESRRLVWCETCRKDVENGRVLVDPLGGIAATFCDRAACRRDAYADLRVTHGTAAGCREVTV